MRKDQERILLVSKDLKPEFENESSIETTLSVESKMKKKKDRI